MLGFCPKGLVEQEELLLFLQQVVELEQVLVFLPLFTHTPTTNIPHHRGLMHHSQSVAHCSVRRALLLVRPTLEYMSLLPCRHLLEAALAHFHHIKHPQNQAEPQGAQKESSWELNAAIRGLPPTQ